MRILRRLCWFLGKLCPVKKNKVIFQNFYGRGYGDNPKYIADALIASGRRVDLAWVVANDRPEDLPASFRTVRFQSLR